MKFYVLIAWDPTLHEFELLACAVGRARLEKWKGLLDAAGATRILSIQEVPLLEASE